MIELTIITSLDSYAMPLVRYRIKDVAVGGESLCSCGRGLPLLRRIEGRADDLVVLPNSAIVSPYELLYHLESVPGVLQFRVIQRKVDQFLLQLKIERDFTKGTVVRKSHTEMTRILGQQSDIEIQIVDEIPRDPSGKVRSVISNIEQGSSKGL